MKRPVLGLAIVATTAASVTALATHHHRRPASASELAPALPLSPRASRAQTRDPLPLVKRTHDRQGTSSSRSSLRVARPAGGSGTLDWPALAACESSDNPHAVDPTGTYFGLYQFDVETWRSVGGTGNPAAASRAEQTFRARILYGQRGRSPWPVCGAQL